MAKVRGRGIAAVNYPTGMNLGGDPTQALIFCQPTGGFSVKLASTDLGQGLKTVIAQIAPQTGACDPDSTEAHATTVADVEVDTETGEVTVLRLASAYEVGRQVNPKMVEGQLIGGAVMGMAHTLMESVFPYYPALEHHTGSFAEYVIPTALDLPEIQSVVLEYPSSNGPYGVKGVGEMTANSPIPAIVNAIYDAVGVWITDLPVTPEKVLRALEAG